jgi:hypothetical protein
MSHLQSANKFGNMETPTKAAPRESLHSPGANGAFEQRGTSPSFYLVHMCVSHKSLCRCIEEEKNLKYITLFSVTELVDGFAGMLLAQEEGRLFVRGIRKDSPAERCGQVCHANKCAILCSCVHASFVCILCVRAHV